MQTDQRKRRALGAGVADPQTRSDIATRNAAGQGCARSIDLRGASAELRADGRVRFLETERDMSGLAAVRAQRYCG